MKQHHIKIVNKARFVSFLTIVFLALAILIGSLVGSNVAEASKVQKYIQIEVSYGDTLWAIASTYGPENQDIRTTIYNICKINNVNASTLQAGDILTIPVN